MNIKTYTLENNTKFQTITIPKGTVLFKGIDITEHNRDAYIKDFVNKGGCIPPTKLVYFYPAPYTGIAVQPYNLYILYTTNYDLELLLLVKPSMHYKMNASNKNESISDIMKICSEIATKDKCEDYMLEDDPCFTESFMKTFPHILGFIGIDANDVGLFKPHYNTLMKHGIKNKIKQIIPTIVENSRGFTGVPEIAIHPLHLRHNFAMKFKYEMNTADTKINSVIKYRARYNYTPLLYITCDAIYTLNDLRNYKNIEDIYTSEHSDYIVHNKLFEKLNKLMKKLLYRGYIVNGTQYRLYIDKYTGFYKIKSNGINLSKNNTIKNINKTMIVNEPGEDDDIAILSHSVKTYVPPEILSGELLMSKENNLNRELQSLERSVLFNKGSYVKKYKINEVFERPDLETKRSRKTRKIIRRTSF